MSNKKQNIWFTSDLHFGHTNVIKYSNRPFASIEEMNEAIISRWNSKVQENDLVYVIGDLTLGRFQEMQSLINRLKGKRILIQGNHDKFSRSQYLQLGFTDVFQELVLKIGSTRVRLSHFPYKPPFWRRLWLPKRAKRYYDRRPPNTGWLLHGHTHYKRKVFKNMIHVGVDAWDYYPVSISQIESILSTSK